MDLNVVIRGNSMCKDSEVSEGLVILEFSGVVCGWSWLEIGKWFERRVRRGKN